MPNEIHETKFIVLADNKQAIRSFSEVQAEIKKTAATAEALSNAMNTGLIGMVARLGPVVGMIVGFGAALRSAADAGDKLNTMAERLGTSVENLSKLDQIARVSGTSIDALESMMGKLAKNMAEAAQGGNQMAKIFQALNIPITDAKNNLRDTSEVMYELAQKFLDMKDGAAKTALSMQLFGRSGKEIVPVLHEMVRSFETLKPLMTTEMARAADQFNDNWEKMKDKIKSFIYIITGPLINAFNRLFDRFHGLKLDEIAKRLENEIKQLEKAIEKPSVTGGLFGGWMMERNKKKLEELRQEYEKVKKMMEIESKPKVGAPIIPDESKIKSLADATAEWKLKIDLLRPGLSELEKEIIQIEHAYRKAVAEGNVSIKLLDEWRDKAKAAAQTKAELITEEWRTKIAQLDPGLSELEKKILNIESAYRKAVAAGTVAIDVLDEWKRKAIEAEKAKAAEEEIQKMIKAREEAGRAWQDLERNLTEVTASEYKKRLANVEDWLEAQLELLYKSFNLEVMTWEQYEEKKTQILEVAAEMRRKIRQREFAGFSEGMAEGIEEYKRSLQDMYSRGKSFAMSFAQETERLLVDMWERPKDAVKNFFNFLFLELKKAIARMIMNPIIVNIQGALGLMPMMGMAGMGMTGMGMTGMGMTGMGLLPSILSYGLLGLAVGRGSLLGGLGGLAGGLLGSAYASTITAGLAGTWLGNLLGVNAMQTATGTILGMSAGTVIPIIGTIIGGLLGGFLSKIFGSSPKHEIALAWRTGDITQYAPGKHWEGQVAPGLGGYAEVLYKNIGDFDKAAAQIAKIFAQVRESVMKTLEKLGYDISGFFKEWEWWPGKDWAKGKTAEEIERAFKEAMGKYIEFASGIDFSKWQKSGEELIDTIDRILSAFMAFPKVLESFDDYIAAIEGNYDEIAKWKDAMREAEENIEKLREALEQATDPADALEYAQQLKQAVYEKYLAEKQLIESLIEQIKNAEEAAFRFAFNLQKTIDNLRGTYQSLDMVYAAAGALLQRYQETTSAWEKLRLLELGIEVVNEGLALTIQRIQDSYNAQIDAINRQREALSKQRDNLQEQLSIARQWRSVLDSVKKQISDMVTSPQLNPADYLELLGYKAQEIERMRLLYAGATGEDKAKYASDLQMLISEYMSLAAQAYQFPSPEYMQIYNNMLSLLESIQGDAEKFAASEIDLLRELKNIEEQERAIDERIKSLTEQMASEIKAAQLQAAEYYEWIKNEGTKIYEEAIAEMREKLASILGDKTVDEYLADLQLAAVTELVQIRDLLEKIWKGLLPEASFATGGYVTKQTLAWVGEKEPEYIIPASKMQGIINGSKKEEGRYKITLPIEYAPTFVINGVSADSGKSIAEEAQRLMLRAIKSGELGDAIISRIKKAGVAIA